MICFSDLLCFRMFHVIIFLTDLVALQLILGCLSWSQGFYLHTKAQTKKWKLKYLIRYLCINTLHTMKGKHCGRKICSICNKHGNNILGIHLAFLGFPGSSAGKESACNTGYSRSVPGLGRSPGEGIGYPLQCFWALLVAQMIKNTPAVLKNWVWPLDWDDLLEKGMATNSNILAWRSPWAEEPGRLQSMGSHRVGHDWATFTSL